MNEFNGVPGPYCIERRDTRTFIASSQPLQLFCKMWGQNDLVDIPTARLLAASWDLLYAAQAAHKLLHDLVGDDSRTYNMLDKAINKALGVSVDDTETGVTK